VITTKGTDIWRDVQSGGAVIADARVVVDIESRQFPPRYGHMAIHPYPIELEGEMRVRDGRALRVRPIRPEDAARENCRYIEVRYSPMLHTRRGLKLTNIVEAVIAGLRDEEGSGVFSFCASDWVRQAAVVRANATAAAPTSAPTTSTAFPNHTGTRSRARASNAFRSIRPA